MNWNAPVSVELTDADVKRTYPLMTRKERRWLNRRRRGLMSWFIRDADFLATEEEFARAALIRYWATVSTVTTRTAEMDWRVKYPGHHGFIRATKDMYEQAVQSGYPARIGAPLMELAKPVAA